MPKRLLHPAGMFIAVGLGLAASLFLLLITPLYAGALSEKADLARRSPPHNIPRLDASPPAFGSNPLLSPANGAALTGFQPAFDWADATDDTGVVSYTLQLSGPLTQTVAFTTTTSNYTSTQTLATGSYTWTVQAHDAAGNTSDFVSPYTFTIQAARQIFLPIIMTSPQPVCPTSSAASFALIPIEGNRADRPDYLHGDLNLSLRGYSETGAAKSLVNYNGSTDPNAPLLAGLFDPNQFPGITTVYQVNHWNWACGVYGCPGSPVTSPEVTLMGLVTSAGQSINIPERTPDIYPGGYKAMVLYAEAQRITLGYTRQDSVAPGYAVHIENVCVDPNLLALYRAQVGPDGLRIFKNGAYWLPALRNNQALGTALGSQIRVAIRDRGTFMDPRSRKDWWPGY